MVRQLFERETAGATDAEGLGAGLERACTRVAESLRVSLGDDGYAALLARAFAKTQTEQPLLKDFHRINAAGIDLDVVSSIEGHGVADVSAALESLLAALVDILSELIGVDMVRNLLDHEESPSALNGRRTL
jgi:hypothetical protein